MRYEMIHSVPVDYIRNHDLRPWAIFRDDHLQDDAPARVFEEDRDDLDSYVVAYLRVDDLTFPIAIKRYAGEPHDVWTVMLPWHRQPSAGDVARLKLAISPDIQPLDQFQDE